ncbi:MAG: glycosyltransferase family 2 protein [Chloroflexi bacterium]|nr:MAG: glycosyltransferase family 2 protein [Chloroflexota bacterium]
MAQLDVVILNYNRGDLLRACLRSLFASESVHQINVWVVDNASSDDSVAIVEREFPQVRLVRNERNSGFASGNNLALRQIVADRHSDYVMLLNNDTLAEPDALHTLVTYLQQHPTVGAVGPKLLLLDGSLDLACRRSFPTPAVSFYRMSGLSKLFPRSARFGRYNLSYLDPDVETEVDALVGAAMVARTAVVREAGLLDETFFMYGEDLDWCYRIKSYGWRIVYDPRAVIHHHKRAASTRRAIPSIRAFYAAMRIFHRKHYAQRTVAPVNWLIEAGITGKEWWALGRNLLRPAARRQVG